MHWQKKKIPNFNAKIQTVLQTHDSIIQLMGQTTSSHWQDAPRDTLLTFFPWEHKTREA